MTRGSILFTLVCAVISLCGCGGKNGLVGGGQGNSVFLQSIELSPLNPTLSLTTSPPAKQAFAVLGRYNVGNPKDITNQMTWLSADPNVATIDANGVATATGSGRVIITTQVFEPATQKTLQTTTVLTVVPQLTGITVSPATARLARGTAQQFTATGNYNDGTSVDITAFVAWNSSQPAATVSSSPGTRGMARGVSAGMANITASSGSLTSSPSPLTVTNANLVSLAVTPGNSTVPLAASRQFVATGSFDDATLQDISNTAAWSSSKPTIARVTSVGLVTGLGLGDSDITASMGAVSDTTTATVDASSVAKVSVVPVTKIANNTASQIRATATFKDGSALDVTDIPGIAWSSSNAGVATITADSGVATATGVGTASISAKLDAHSGSTTLAVSDATLLSLAVAPNQVTIAPGTTQNVVALATFNDAAGKFQQDISNVAAWSSDNIAAATVSFDDGRQELAHGVAMGTANLSASFSDAHANVVTGSAALTVSAATLRGIGVAPGDAAVTFGGGQQLVATGTFSDGTQQDLTRIADWIVSDNAIATVSPFGFAAANGPGQTSVTAKVGSQTGSSSLLVNPGALRKIDICAAGIADPLNNCPPLDPVTPPPPLSFAKNVPFALVAIGTFTDGSREDLTSSVRWTTSSTAIASISNDPGIPGFVTGIPGQGMVTGFASGHVTLTATAGGMSGATDAIVTDATPVLLNVTPQNGTAQLGFAQPFTVVATFTDNTTEVVTPNVRWTTSDPAIVVVYPGGLAYPSGAGVATVTAALGSASGATTLTVQ